MEITNTEKLIMIIAGILTLCLILCLPFYVISKKSKIESKEQPPKEYHLKPGQSISRDTIPPNSVIILDNDYKSIILNKK